jgi:hypothetical protein
MERKSEAKSKTKNKGSIKGLTEAAEKEIFNSLIELNAKFDTSIEPLCRISFFPEDDKQITFPNKSRFLDSLKARLKNEKHSGEKRLLMTLCIYLKVWKN